MKVLIVIALVAVVANAELSQDFKTKVVQMVQDIGTSCAESENASGDDIGELLAKKMPSKKEGKCLLACVNQKFEIQDKDGKLDMAGAMKTFDQFKAEDEEIYGKIKKIVETCIPEAGDTGDRCETAVKYASCSKRVSEELDITEAIFF